MSFINDLCARIVENPCFNADFEAIVRQSILAGMDLGYEARLEEEAVRRLLQSAAILSQSTEPEWRQLAYRISVGSLAYQKVLEGVPEAARLTFARLGNYPAIRYAFGGKPEPKTLTASVFYEIAGREFDNTISIGERYAVLTDMQKSVWDAASAGSSLALSAPTSARKSFVFQAYIEQVKRREPKTNIVYLVPSRALISQVANDLKTSGANRSYGVATIPLLSQTENLSTPIFVLTPERLQVLLQTEPELAFEIAIVDEAHLLGEGSRGIVLHSVLQDLQRRNAETQFLFSSPQVRDPSVFGTIVGKASVKVVKTKDSPVAQNIIILKGSAIDSRRIDVVLWKDGRELALTTIDALLPIYNSFDRLIYTSWLLGSGSQSLVYAEGPASCEDIAFKIKDLRSDSSVTPTGSEQEISEETKQARAELSSFAKEAVHPTYVLADTVLGGVGFHYGRIPALLRNAIEDSFSAGYLNYIVCTSTLLQGVNLPARNIFMQNPHKGEDHPIDPVDFWNLAGRAGRLGKDFQGNVFLVDYDQWESAPLAGPKDEPVRPTLEATLVEYSAELLEYIASGDRPSGESPVLEAAFSKLLRDHRHGQLEETLSRLPALSPETRSKVEAALAAVNEAINVSTETLDANPQISGYRQQQLYDYMVAKIGEKGSDYLIPVHPSASWSDALNRLRPVFARVHKYLELNSGQHHKYWAPLALRWMRGEPLPKIIDEAIKYYKRQGKSRSNRTVIREVLTDIESHLRFRYVNLLGCYTSVLKQALSEKGYAQHIQRIPSLTLYLELGAASNTMIQLMSLGLSRHTASTIANLTINKDMDMRTAQSFLRRLNPEMAGLSPFLASEVRRVVEAL